MTCNGNPLFWALQVQFSIPVVQLVLQPCNKGRKMNCWEALYMQAFYQRNILIEKQNVIDINPLYELAQHVTQPATYSLTQTAEQCNMHTPTRVISANFDTIHFVLENPIITVLDKLLFITDLLIYAATPPLN